MLPPISEECRLVLRGLGEWENLSWTSDRCLGIGRMSTCEVVIDDPSVSRRHAEIFHSKNGWMIRDLGSTNGTLLNGLRLSRIEQRLQKNDLVQPGNITLTIEELIEATDPSISSPDAGSSFEVRAASSKSLEGTIEVAPPALADEPVVHLPQQGCHLPKIDSLNDFLSCCLKDAVHSLDARRGAIFLADSTSNLTLRVACNPNNLGGDFSSVIARRCLRQATSLLCESGQDREFKDHSPAENGMRSVICALLRTSGKVLGVLHLDRGCAQARFRTQDLQLADGMAASMSAGLETVQVLLDRQQNLFMQTVLALVQAVECRDQYTAGHTQRVTDYALLLAEQLKVSEADFQNIQIGTPLHDIGKIGIDDAILRKPGRLSIPEFDQIKSHTVKGVAILESLPQLLPVLPIVRNHHERWNGLGYPDGLAGEQISPLARIVTVADVFDALTSERPYRSALPTDDAFAILQEGAGSYFDPTICKAFLRLRPRLEKMLRDRGAFTETISKQELGKIMESLHKSGIRRPARPERPGPPTPDRGLMNR